MSDTGDRVRSGRQRASETHSRAVWPRILLALNVASVVVCASVVWTKLASADLSDESKQRVLTHAQTESGTDPRAAGAATDEPPDRLGPLHTASPPTASDSRATRAVPDDPATRERLAETRARISRVRVHLEAVYNKAGSYPTSARGFGGHRGVEALYAALATRGRSDGAEVGDADGDGRLEFLDAWGRPFVYFSLDDYGTEQKWNSGRAQSVSVVASRCRAHDVVHTTNGFQLWSVGPNGRNESGSGDDVTSWTPHD